MPDQPTVVQQLMAQHRWSERPSALVQGIYQYRCLDADCKAQMTIERRSMHEDYNRRFDAGDL